MTQVEFAPRPRPFGAMALAAALLLAACTAATGPTIQERAQGTWQGVATSSARTSPSGVPCADAAGGFDIAGDRINGEVVHSVTGAVFVVTAIVSPAGAIDGGFAIAGNSIATWSGQIAADGRSATGEWADVDLCRGTWSARKQ